MDQFGEDWSVEFLDPDPPPGVDSAEWSVEHLDNPQSFPAEPLEEETPDWFECFITKHELQDEDMPDANCGSLLLDVGIARRQQGQPGLIGLFGCLQVD